MPIRLKKLIGTFLLVALVIIYALVASIIAVAQLSESGPLVHFLFFLFSGLFWSGQQAVELGLADQLGGLEYVAREVVKAEEIIDYTRRENVAERLAKKFGAAMGEGAVKAFKVIPAIR